MTSVNVALRDWFSSHYSTTDMQRLELCWTPALRNADAAFQKSQKSIGAVGSKVLKLAASDFSYQKYPSANTMNLTAMVASLIRHEILNEFLPANGIANVDHLTVLLGYAAQQLGLSKAALLLIPFFEVIAARSCYALDLPQIINGFIPGVPLHRYTQAQRFALLEEELARRGILIHDAAEPQNAESGVLNVPVVRKGKLRQHVLHVHRLRCRDCEATCGC